MANTKRNIWDDVADGLRQVLEDLDRLLNPTKHRKPAPVPVPVRSRPDRRDNNPYAPRR